MRFARTVLNLAALQALLPAVRTLKLRSLSVLNSNITPECCPELVKAFSRPTLALSDPPPVWWWVRGAHAGGGGAPAAAGRGTRASCTVCCARPRGGPPTVA